MSCAAVPLVPWICPMLCRMGCSEEDCRTKPSITPDAMLLSDERCPLFVCPAPRGQRRIWKLQHSRCSRALEKPNFPCVFCFPRKSSSLIRRRPHRAVTKAHSQSFSRCSPDFPTATHARNSQQPSRRLREGAAAETGNKVRRSTA